MKAIPAKFVALFLSAIFFAAAFAWAAAIKDDAEVFAGRDKKIGRIRAGEPVTVLAESGDWVKVHYETADSLLEGFVKRDLVDMTATSPAPATVSVTADESTNADSTATNAAKIARPPIPAPAVPAAGRVYEIGLSSHWLAQAGGGSIIASDFARLLRDVATPQTNAAVAQNCVLYKDLYFPMPITAALRLYNQSVVMPEAVNTPGFPADSFKAYTFDPKIDNVSQMTLVADTKGQLVAVELRDTGLHPPAYSTAFAGFDHAIPYATDLRLYDIVHGRTKGNSDWRVGAIAEQTNGVLRIDTELITAGVLYEGSFGSARSKERDHLFLPQTVADLCAGVLRNRK